MEILEPAKAGDIFYLYQEHFISNCVPLKIRRAELL